MKPRSVPISVEGYIGLPGAGKTYALAWRGLEAIESGRTVFSNFDLAGTLAIQGWNHGDEQDPCDCGECFVSISDAVVLIDEINLWAPSRMWDKLPLQLLHRWAQVRKYRTQILWSAQHEARVDKAIREVTGWMWACRPAVFGRWFYYRAFEPHDLRKAVGRPKPLSTQWLRLRPEVAEAYDTLELIGFGDHLVKRRDVATVELVVPTEPGGSAATNGEVDETVGSLWG